MTKKLLEMLAAQGLGTLEEFDLTDPKDVERLALEFGAVWAEAIAPIAAATPEEHRGLLFGYAFAAPLGAMSRAIGLENYDVVLAQIRKAAELVAARRAATRH